MKKRNRTIALVLAAAMTLALPLAGCGSKTDSAAPAPAADSKTEAAPAASGDGVSGVTLKLSHGLTEEHPIQAALQQFADEVGEKTDGAIKVEIYPNATLGAEKDNLEQLPIGALDMAKVSAASLETFAPVYEAFSVPYIFNDQEHFYNVMDSDVAEDIFKSTEGQGFIALTWFDSGARSFFTTNKPINTPADLAGLKIRTMDSPMAFEMMECFGGSATTMSISEVYTAMQSGVIDGAENNETALVIGGIGEVAKCFSEDEHTRIPDILVISTKVWNKMSADQQAIVKTAADNAKESYKKAWNDAIADAIEKSQADLGVEFTYPDKTPFQEAVKPIYERVSKEKPEVWDVCQKIQEMGK